MIKNFIKAASILFLIVVTLTPALAQQDKELRLEIPVKPSAPKPELIAMGEQGFILVNKNYGVEDGERTIYIEKYDAKFEKNWQNEIKYNKKLRLGRYEYFEDLTTLYMIFNEDSREELQVFRINAITGHIDEYNFYYLSRLTINNFTVDDNILYAAGTLKRQPVALALNLNTNRVSPIPSVYDGKSVFIQDIRNVNDKEIGLTVSLEQNRRRMIILRTFRKDKTNSFNDLRIQPEPEYDLINAKASKLANGNKKIVIGTFGFRNNENSQGFYFSRYNSNGDQDYIKYHSFTDLDNFFSFLDEKQRIKTELRAERKKQKGKDLKVQYRLLVHDVIDSDDQYIMIGEAYYPVYRTERINNFYGRRNYQTRLIFDGYQYTHAVIAGFDKQGELVWDHSFKIEDVKSFTLKERVKLNLEDTNLTLLYNLEGKINRLEIADGEIVDEEEDLELASKYDSDQIKFADLGESEYWYKNYFLAWGYQRIKNQQNEASKKKRSVFYVNKLSF
ncbi:MAG: hypothetical protein AAFX87_11180 [Bacteroidota bacterium]